MRLKSNQQKQLSGTLNESKIVNFEGEKIGKEIFSLSKTEKSIYDKIVLHLENNSASNEIDSFYCSIAARVIGVLILNAKSLSEAGSIMTYPNGTRQISAEWTAFKQSYETFKDISKVLGLDPKSRLSMDYFVNDHEDLEDPFAQFFTKN